MKKLFLFTALLIYCTVTQAQDVVINEVQASNYNTFKVYSTLYDWIELKNTTASEINLGGWSLTAGSTTWVFPSYKTIDANATLLVLAMGNGQTLSGYTCANITLSTTDEVVVLSSPQGDEVQKIEYPFLKNNISYGRMDDGSYSYMSIPTPGTENNTYSAFKYLQTKLSTNIQSGLYNSPQKVELTATSEGQIYYTLDGTTPSSKSLKYSAAIDIDKTTVLKAIVVKSDHEYSEVEYRSFILGASHSLPVVILTSDTATRNYNNKQVIDGRVEFSFIEQDGTTAINQYANFEASGNSSKGLPPLIGKVKASKLYGDSDFDHKMYPYKEFKEFKSFLLRNSSQDWKSTYLRDGYVSTILGKDNLFDIAFESYRPAVLYVNGVYQGITNIREDDDNDFVKLNFGLESEDFSYSAVVPNFYTQDLSIDWQRAQFDKAVNLHEYISLRLLYTYTEDQDYRTVMWVDLSGKTPYQAHFSIHDFDAGLALGYGASVINVNPMILDRIIPQNVEKYIPYRNEAILFIAAQLNHIYNTDRTLSILDQMRAVVIDEIPAHAVKMNELANETTYKLRDEEMPYADVDAWKKNMDDLRTHVSYRIDTNIFNRIKDKYNLDGTIDITYETSDTNKGHVRVQDIKVLEQSFTGTYFSNMPIRFSAQPMRGYRFVRWEGDVSSTNKEITPSFASNAKIKAVFEAIETLPNGPVVNEIQAKNNNTVADEAGEFNDWIEIYNPTNVAVNIAGMYISDNFDKPLKWKIPATNASKTTVPANGFLLLWADTDVDQGENHLNFKLTPSDQVILTSADGLTPIQYIEFNDVEDDISFAAQIDGSTTFLVTANPTPNATNIITQVIKTYSVVFADFDGTELKSETVDNGKAATAPTNPIRIGYTFTGWNINFSNITKDLIVTAQYKINSYTVVFQDFDGTELFSETVAFETKATAPINPIRTGYTFTGWDVDFSKITKDLIITAQYSVNSYTVVFQDFDGTELFSETVAFETKATAPINPIRTGYTFTGWNVDFSKITRDLIITAQYKINSYTVVFQDFDGTELFSETVAFETKATAPLNPIRTGYTFTGWNVDFSIITKDLIITAQYSINTYTVLFQDFDGTELFSETVAFENAATAPINPSRTGYTFTGWDVDFSKITRDLIITAQYKINSYTVVFQDFDGTELFSETVASETKATAPLNPIRTGYTFTGWDVDFSKITRDLIITA
ncbi:MAG: InlB B-repeat-containing protein [Bacteroidales bacterium]|nr:InlB B-repeat-containing protein [Bacteroidales bacterium]